MSFFAELKRRNVVKVSLAYLALGWVVIEVTTTVTPLLNLPEWLPSVVVWIGIIGFPFVAVFSWIYELSPEGLKLESEISRSSPAAQPAARRLYYTTNSNYRALITPARRGKHKEPNSPSTVPSPKSQ